MNRILAFRVICVFETEFTHASCNEGHFAHNPNHVDMRRNIEQILQFV